MKFFIVDEGAGHRVETSTAASDALQRIPESVPDCTITDIMMPRMDGFELTRELRRRPELAGMKIIVLSAKTYEFDRRRAKELGADGYIAKPFKRDTLLEAIQEIISQHVTVTYWGVHGTLPTPGPAYKR